jgi:hypothetical protein
MHTCMAFQHALSMRPLLMTGETSRLMIALPFSCCNACAGHHLWNSGGAEIIQDLVGKGAIYVGASAGSIMAGRTCQMALWKACARPLMRARARYPTKPTANRFSSADADGRVAAHPSPVLQDWDDKTCEGTVSVDWNDKSIARGLDLALGRSIFPHANGQYADKDWQQAQAKKHGHTDHEVVALADGHGLVIDGDVARLV